MKTKEIKTMHHIMLLLLMVFALTSCAEDGEPGPIGPDGTQGEQGEQGDQGDQGEKGEKGNANVTIKTFVPDPGPYLAWEEGSYLGAESLVFEINDTEITQEVVDSYLIIVFIQVFEEETWYPMPFVFPLSSGNDQLVTFTYSHENLSIYTLQPEGLLNAPISSVRYFLIEGNIASRSLTSVDITDYNAVLEYYGLE